jgi:hypothetical protein
MPSSGILHHVALVRTNVHGVTSLKTAFFIVNAVKTSNLTFLRLYSVFTYMEVFGQWCQF